MTNDRHVSDFDPPNGEERELLEILHEECNEVGQRISKAMRFGLPEIQPDQLLKNSERIGHEAGELQEVLDRLILNGTIRPIDLLHGRNNKRRKLPQYLQEPATPFRHLFFYGASDDNFEVGIANGKHRKGEPDEVDCYRGNVVVQLIDPTNGNAMLVIGEYINPGVWMIGVAPNDEDAPLPPWPMHYEFENYTAKLNIYVPNEVVISLVTQKDDPD